MTVQAIALGTPKKPGQVLDLEPRPLSDVETLPLPPTSAQGPIIGGLITLVIAVGGFGLWAALAPLHSAVVAGGTVVVESSRRDVQHLDGGIVSEILVKDGDRVAVGDALLRLDSTRVQAGLTIVQGQIDVGLALQARLRAEQENLPQIVYPDALTERASDRGVADLMRAQTGVFKTRRTAREGQISILHQRIAQFEEQITGLRAQEKSRTQQIRSLEEELRGTHELAGKGYAPRTKVLAMERELARMRGDRGEHQATVARMRQAIGEAQLQIMQVEKTFREELARELQDVQNRLFELFERQTATQDVVQRLELRAPTEGVVVSLSVTTVGAVIQPGRTIMQIVPMDDVLIIEANVMTNDIENLVVGKDANIRFPAITTRTMPNLTGMLTHLSADRLMDERSGVPYYKAKVKIDKRSLELLGDNRLVPGMPAEVMITTGERTALDYLIKPFSDVLSYSFREK